MKIWNLKDKYRVNSINNNNKYKIISLKIKTNRMKLNNRRL